MSTTSLYVWKLLSSPHFSTLVFSLTLPSLVLFPLLSSFFLLSSLLSFPLLSSLVSASPLVSSFSFFLIRLVSFPLLFSSALLPSLLHSSGFISFCLLSSPLPSFPLPFLSSPLLLLTFRFTADRYFDAVEAVKRSASPSETKIHACFIEVRENCVCT